VHSSQDSVASGVQVSGHVAALEARVAPPVEVPKPPPLQLVVGQGSHGGANEALPMNVSLSGAADGAMVMIDGLAAGSTMSVGRASGASGWQLMAADLRNALVQPPQGFVGAMQLGLELRLADESLADLKTQRLEWAAPVAPVAPTPKSGFVLRHLDPDEVTALVKRGEDFIASGDLASARLVLQRAAEAGEAQAALSLAGTYDPIVLEKFGFKGPTADIAKARFWYERAQEFGSPKATVRLQSLASRDH
jgi:hypothetical protein